LIDTTTCMKPSCAEMPVTRILTPNPGSGTLAKPGG
jgi:hypothetical protein